MEPGHEDREYQTGVTIDGVEDPPQWSPVMKTGNTSSGPGSSPAAGSLNGARS